MKKNKQKNKSPKRSILGCGFLILIIMSLPFLTCGFWYILNFTPYYEIVPEQYASLIPPTPTPQPGDIAKDLLFSGKVINLDGTKWHNNRLVIVYLNGQEIQRTTSEVGSSDLTKDGLTDGHFKIQLPNTYEIPENRFDFTGFTVTTDTYTSFGKIVPSSVQEIWFGGMVEGGLYEIPIPSKNLSYYIKVFATDNANLPPELLQDGSTRLTEENEVALALDWDTSEHSPNRALIQGIKTNIREETVEMESFIVPIDNCKGTTTLNQYYEHTQTFYHEYETEVTASAGIDTPIFKGLAQLLLELEGTYGFNQGQVNSRQIKTDMTAQPREKVIYTITWLETWEIGTAIIDTGEELIEIPFRVRKDISYQSEANAEFNCS